MIDGQGIGAAHSASVARFWSASLVQLEGFICQKPRLLSRALSPFVFQVTGADVINQIVGDIADLLIPANLSTEWSILQRQPARDRGPHSGQSGIDDGICACAGKLLADDDVPSRDNDDDPYDDPEKFHAAP